MGKGGGRAHTPVEAKDNLKSTQMMSVIDAIGEGPVEGPVKGLQSILVNKTPLTDTDGNPVIHGVTAVWRAGEQEQTPPEGFESSGSETALGVEVTKAKPVTRTITSANIDRLRVTFGVQSLVQTTSQGDRNPASVRLLIQLQRNGNWVTEKDVTINGKTTSQFLASVILDNLPPRPFNIRMVRETADSTTDQLQNKTLWSSYTEIIDVKQCYPNTAIVGLQVDAEQFGGQQMTVNYHIRGRIIQVPSNYDPEKRTYSGIWDGSLKPAYSNNPAWCLWDMLTLQLQRPEGPPHGGGGELHRPAERLADLHGTGGRPGSHTALRAQPAEDGCVRLHQSRSGPPCRAVGDKDRTAGNADGGFHARVTGAASHTR